MILKMKKHLSKTFTTILLIFALVFLAGSFLHKMALFGIKFDHPYVYQFLIATDIICALFLVVYVGSLIKEYNEGDMENNKKDSQNDNRLK